MDARNWGELPNDCLVNVFGRVGIEALFYDVPFVCKHWCKAARNPLCWKEILFFDLTTHPLENQPKYEILVRPRRPLVGEQLKIYFSEMLKHAVDRSCGLATKIWLPRYCTKEALFYAANKCPRLKSLGMARVPLAFTHDLKRVIYKLENLESMLIGHSLDLIALFIELKTHCDNLQSLVLLGCQSYEVFVVPGHFPDLKSLAIFDTFIHKKDLMQVLKGCRGLVKCTISGHFSFDMDDEVLRLARRVPMFEYHAFTNDPSLFRRDPAHFCLDINEDEEDEEDESSEDDE